MVFGIEGGQGTAEGASAPVRESVVAAPAAPVAPSRPRFEDVWAPGRELTLDQLRGMPEFLDALESLGFEARLAEGLSFKVYDVSNGPAEFVEDWGTRVPTAAALQEVYPEGGDFEVRPSRRRESKGGGNVTAVRVRVRGRRPKTGNDVSSRELIELLRDVLVEKSAASKTPARTPADETEPPAWMLSLIGEVKGLAAPYVPLLKKAASRIATGEADGADLIALLKESGLLKAVSDRIAGPAAVENKGA